MCLCILDEKNDLPVIFFWVTDDNFLELYQLTIHRGKPQVWSQGNLGSRLTFDNSFKYQEPKVAKNESEYFVL